MSSGHDPDFIIISAAPYDSTWLTVRDAPHGIIRHTLQEKTPINKGFHSAQRPDGVINTVINAL